MHRAAGRRAQRRLEERLRFETLLAEVSAKLIHVDAGRLDTALEGALQQVVVVLEMDRGRLDAAIDGAPAMRLSCVGPGVDPERYDGAPSPSHLSIPLRGGGPPLGALSFDSVRGERGWPDDLVDRLHLLSGAFASALERRRIELSLAARLGEAGRLRQELTHIGRVSALGELTASLAHELNQPLTAILANAQVAQRLLDADVPDLAELHEILDDIVADDKRAADVIRRLRILLKKGELEHVRLDINDVVGAVAQVVKHDMVIRNVPMTLDLAPGLPVVRGDRAQLQQVVLNMVLNGLEAMREPNGRDPALVIRTARAGAGAIAVAIEDSGTGIATPDVDSIFHPLYTTKTDGLGMGLAIARTIVDAHGGHLQGANNASGGATFQFTLPVDGAQPR